MTSVVPTSQCPTALELADVQNAFGEALASGNTSELNIIGYGEITCVLRWRMNGRDYACKPLPRFASAAALSAYQQTLATYISEISARAVDVLDTRIHVLSDEAPGLLAWCLQPAVGKESLLPAVLHRADDAEALDVVSRLFDVISGAVDGHVGLDGQASNWALVDDRFVYFDVATPMLRDGRGRERLDPEVVLAALPRPLRRVAKRTLMKPILDHYYSVRAVFIDFLANLQKEGLPALIPAGILIANAKLQAHEQPISREEVSRYYESDARVWTWVMRVRRWERWWQQNVKRGTYPYLLPESTERHL
jgi:hypothetical protein